MTTAAGPVEVLKPSKEKTNYIRLARLLMCGGTTIVRGKFDSIIPPSRLQAKLNEPAVFTRLHQMRKDKILFSSQWKVLFPSSSTYGKSESFDITLLFKLLREFCGLPVPPKGWDDLPDDKDHSLSADLARIKYYRNELCHAKEDLGISDGDFNTYGKRIKDALLRIAQTLPSLGPSKDWENEIDKLLTGPITDDDERNIEELKSWYRQDMEVKAMLEQLPERIVVRLREEKIILLSKDRDDYGERLVKFLQEYYSKGEWSLILPFPWMEGDRFHIENQYTSLTINEKEHSNETQVENLFSPSEGSQDVSVRRILIEGEAGIGKSTFCKKIAYDWSKNKLQIPDIDLVLVIKCCDLKDGDLWQAIEEQNLPEDLHGTQKAEEVFDYIRVNQERVLLIVDGFDEIPVTTENTIEQGIKRLVTGKLLSNAHVILTSRPERCSDIRKCFDKKLEMTGFSWNDSCHFIKHFSSSSPNAAETISSLEKTAALRELTRCPLNAAFLCLVLEEKEGDDTFFKSLDIGSLYREMVFCVLKRYHVEKKRQEVQDDTLMDKYHEVQVMLGKIAFNLMKDNLTKVPEEILPVDSKQILRDVGFLIEYKSLNQIRPTSTYSFSHSSIKEYFAAFYVADSLRNGNIDILTSIHKCQENPSSTGIGQSNHVQNVYYSLQRFNLPEMANLPRSEDYIKLINGLAAHLPKDIDVSQAEPTRFDCIFSFICELLGKCQGDRVTEVLKKIVIPDLLVVFYLYNCKQALDGFVSLLSQSKEEISEVKVRILRLEGLQAVSTNDFIKLSRILGEHKFLQTLYLSFFSDSKEFLIFFDNFQSKSLENLGLHYIPQESSKGSNIFKILESLCNLSSLDLSNSPITYNTQFWYSKSVLTRKAALKVLKLRHCNLRSGDVGSILRSLRTSTTIKELDLSGNDFSYGFHIDLEGSTLQVLRMRNCNLRSVDFDFPFHYSLRTGTTLKELDLSGNDFSYGFHIDLEGSTLKVLRMRNCNLRSVDFDFLFHHSLRTGTTLKELDLSGNDFSNGFHIDLEGSTLKVLRMRNCNLRSGDVDSILRSLRTSNTLRELDLSGNDFSDGFHIDLDGSTLQVLRMRNCNLRSGDVDSISRSLRTSTTLKELDLSGNDFSDGFILI